MFDYTDEIWEPEVHTEIDNDAEADNAEDEARAAEEADPDADSFGIEAYRRELAAEEAYYSAPTEPDWG